MLLLVPLVWGCAPQEAAPAGHSSGQPGPVAATSAPGAINAAAAERPVSLRADAGRVYTGTGVVVRPRAPVSGGAAEVGTEPGDVTLNFVDTDVREILRTVLGDLLHLNYVVDSKVQASLTVQTGRPLKRADVLPILQQVLQAGGLDLIEAGGIYHVSPSGDASRTGTLPIIVDGGRTPTGADTTRYEVRVLPLRYASATEMQRTLEPYLPKAAALQVDTARNVLILSGTGQDLSTVAEMVRTFDFDWIAGMSFGVIPLQTATPKDVVVQLARIFGPDGTLPLPGVLRFAPLDRMSAILVVSPQRGYIEQARSWIERLDRGEDENRPRIFQYRVQNSRASDVAKVMSGLFSTGAVRTVLPQTAPGTTPTSIGQAAYGLGAAVGGTGTTPLTSPQTGASAPTTNAPGTGTLGSPIARLGAALSPATPSSLEPSAATSETESSSSVAASAQPGLESPPVRIVADEKNNTLVIYARPKDYRMIEDALEKIDVVPLQVLIEATIAEVTLNNDLQYGLQYFLRSHNNQFLFGSSPSSILPPIPGTFPGFNYIFSTSNTNLVLNALSAITNLHVISSPELLVLDHQVASLVVGNEVPIPISQTTYASTTITGQPITSNSIQYVDTGVVLRVSPRVNTSGIITLEISQEVSNVSNTPAVNTPIGAPTIEQRKVQSTITVQDGESIALGGLITDSKSTTKNGIPLLSEVPILGALFRSTENTKSRTELLILLSPKILHNPNEARAATDELRRRLRGLAADSD